MVRKLRVAAVQVGRIDRGAPRAGIIARLVALLDQAAAQQVKLAVFPETTFSTFFPRYYIEDDAELSAYFEKEPAEGIAHCETVKAFFDRAKELGVDVAIGYGEEAPDGRRFNSASYVDSTGRTAGKYRKIHLPGPSSSPSSSPSRRELTLVHALQAPSSRSARSQASRTSSRSATSRRATSASTPSARRRSSRRAAATSRPSLGSSSATTGGGPRAGVSSACRASRSCASATTRPPGRRSSGGSTRRP